MIRTPRKRLHNYQHCLECIEAARKVQRLARLPKGQTISRTGEASPNVPTALLPIDLPSTSHRTKLAPFREKLDQFLRRQSLG